ncbi:MAG: hypothetical protein P8I97_06350 [Verrucomicrobiales bacterium]|jgi:hypothetical protein|nr:hypothetical protein [Verrucomicrobiales bacterium]
MAKKSIDKTICFPGEDGWELWKQTEDSFGQAEYELLEKRELDESGSCEPFKDATHYAFPINSVFAVPIWVGIDDSALIKNLVEMQLEKMGLKPISASGQLLDYQTVCVLEPEPSAESEEAPVKRSLILASVLNPEYKHPLPKTGSKEFDVSARFLQMPGEHILVWKELGRLVMAVTHEGQLEYFEGLTSNKFNSAAVNEINCIMLGLDGAGPVSGDFKGGIANELSGAHIWLDEFDQSAKGELGEILGIEVTSGSKPDPFLPDSTSNLVPSEVVDQRAQQKKSQQIRYALLGAVAVYILLVVVLLGSYFKEKWAADKLADQVKKLEPSVQWIPEFREKWRELSSALDADSYPAELLHRATAAVPPQDVRFTSFKYDDRIEVGGKLKRIIVIDGQSKDAKAGRDFYALLTKNKNLEYFKWAWLKQPQVDPRKKDRTAVFQIRGETTL